MIGKVYNFCLFTFMTHYEKNLHGAKTVIRNTNLQPLSCFFVLARPRPCYPEGWSQWLKGQCMLVSRYVVCVPEPWNRSHTLQLCPAGTGWNWPHLGLSWLVLFVGVSSCWGCPGAYKVPGTGELRMAPGPAFGALGEHIGLYINQIGMEAESISHSWSDTSLRTHPSDPAWQSPVIPGCWV